MKKYEFSDRKRIFFVKLLIGLTFIYTIYKLVDVQVINGPKYRAGALEQTTKNIRISSERGDIYDRNGKKLAVSKVSYTPWIYSNELPDEIDLEKLADDISTITGLEKSIFYDRLINRQGNFKITQWIEKDQAEKLKDLKVRGLRVEEGRQRYYPFASNASYIIGFTDIDNNGIEGIENRYNNFLTGTRGRMVTMTDNKGNPLPLTDKKEYQSSDGLSVVTTIDMELQQICEEALKKSYEDTSALKTHIIAMEPKTGKILAMAAYPDYDLNNPREPRNEAEREAREGMDQDQLLKAWYDTWRNDNISNVYEPGSTFKVFTAAIGLEEGVATTNSKYLCNGIFTDFKDTPLRCYNYDDPHGLITLRYGFKESCNITFIRLGLDIGIDTYYKYLNSFGFGESTGLDLYGESEGLIPSYDRFKAINLATTSYGHGLSITPIQLITGASCIVNGGDLMRPYIVDSLINEKNEVVEKTEPFVRRKVLSKETSDAVNSMMKETVESGTGRKIRRVGYSIGGKTGTSIKFANGKYSEDHILATMIATIPAEDPKIIFLAMVDEPKTRYKNGGVVAAALLDNIFDRALPYLGIVGNEEKNQVKNMPNLVGMKTLDAGKMLDNLEIPFKSEFDEPTKTDFVLSQSLPEGSPIDENSSVILKLGGQEEKIMPDLVGLKRSEAVKILDSIGNSYSIGSGNKVVSQMPAAGSVIDGSVEIKIELGE
ncbi:MAG: PASTA domain-containing protein [Tissierellia bacterium]|nr:PASTA domain-containing protein [Tissierellia bacterium]